MVLRRSEDFKFYLYVSTSKTKMLYQQVSHADTRKKSVEWNVKLPALSAKQITTTEEKVDRDEMVKRSWKS